MARVREAFLPARDTERLARAGSGPNGSVVGPSGETEGVGPSADAREEMALGEAIEVRRGDIVNRSAIHGAGGDDPGGGEVAQPGRSVGIIFIVVGGHPATPVGLLFVRVSGQQGNKLPVNQGVAGPTPLVGCTPSGWPGVGMVSADVGMSRGRAAPFTGGALWLLNCPWLPCCEGS